MINTKYKLPLILAAGIGLSACSSDDALQRVIGQADSVSRYSTNEEIKVPDFLTYKDTINLTYLCGMNANDMSQSQVAARNSLLLKLKGKSLDDSVDYGFYFLDEFKSGNTALWRVLTDDLETPLLEIFVKYKPNKNDLYQTPEIKSVEVIQRFFGEDTLNADQVTRYVPAENNGTKWTTAFVDYAVYGSDGHKAAIGDSAYILTNAETTRLEDVAAQIIMRSEGKKLREKFEGKNVQPANELKSGNGIMHDM